MLANKFLSLLRSNRARLGEQWVKRLRTSEHMQAFQKMSDEELQRRTERFYDNLVMWLEEGALHEKIKTYFSRVGRERYHERIPLEEINLSIIIGKTVLWRFILSEGFLANALAIYQALEMLTMIYNFFDMGFYYIGEEYMKEMYEQISRSKKFTEQELKDHLFPGKLATNKELEAMFGINLGIK